MKLHFVHIAHRLKQNISIEFDRNKIEKDPRKGIGNIELAELHDL